MKFGHEELSNQIHSNVKEEKTRQPNLLFLECNIKN